MKVLKTLTFGVMNKGSQNPDPCSTSEAYSSSRAAEATSPRRELCRHGFEVAS